MHALERVPVRCEHLADVDTIGGLCRHVDAANARGKTAELASGAGTRIIQAFTRRRQPGPILHGLRTMMPPRGVAEEAPGAYEDFTAWSIPGVVPRSLLRQPWCIKGAVRDRRQRIPIQSRSRRVE